MTPGKLGRKLNDPSLVAELRPLRRTDNTTNLLYLALDYATLAAVVAPTIAWSVYRQEMGLSWVWEIPSVAVAIILVGAIQHRLAGLAHEAAHYTLFKNRLANDLIADLFCLFPIFATNQQYRVTHLAHHQYTNDWERDPDLIQVGRPKGMHEFPMTRAAFMGRYFVRFLLPWNLFGYLWNIMSQSVFGYGANPYVRSNEVNSTGDRQPIRWSSLLGTAYFLGLAFVMNQLFAAGMFHTLAFTLATAFVSAVGILAILPDSAFFQSPVRHAYSERTAALLRLTWSTAFLSLFPLGRWGTGIDLSAYFWLLWVVPLATSFSYFMLLRDVYQHANADQGRLTNSRVFFTDPFTWWAVFVYGQDMHIPHHLFPAIPHYHLETAHEILKSKNEEYRQHVVECEGTFANHSGKPTILDVMEHPTREPEILSSDRISSEDRIRRAS